MTSASTLLGLFLFLLSLGLTSGQTSEEQACLRQYVQEALAVAGISDGCEQLRDYAKCLITVNGLYREEAAGLLENFKNSLKTQIDTQGIACSLDVSEMVKEVEEELGLLSTTAGTTVISPTTVVTTSRPSGEIQTCFNTYVSEIRNSSLEDDLCQPLGRFVRCLLSSADSALTAGQVDNLQNSIDNQLFTNNLTCDINATVIYQDLSPSNTTADQLTAPTTAASTTEAGSSTTGAVNSTSAQTTLTTGDTTLTTGDTTLTTGETTLTTGETTLTTGETTLTAGKTTLTTEEITLTAGENSFTTGETTPTTGETTLTTGETTLTTGNNITITQPGYKTVANDETSTTRVTTDSGISSSELGNTTTVGSPPTTPAAKASTASPGGVTSLEGNANNYWSTTENTRDSAGLVESSKIVIMVSIFFALYKNVFESLVD